MGKVCENEKRGGERRIIEKREHDATTYDVAKTNECLCRRSTLQCGR